MNKMVKKKADRCCFCDAKHKLVNPVIFYGYNITATKHRKGNCKLCLKFQRERVLWQLYQKSSEENWTIL